MQNRSIRWLAAGCLCLAAAAAQAEEPTVGAPAKIEPPAIAVATATPAPTGWKPNAVGQFNLTQNAFSNWTQGGQNMFSYQVNLLAGADYSSPDLIWTNTGKFVYGATQIKEEAFRKSADEIRLESVLTYQLPTVVKPYAALRAESQFATGYKYDGDTVTAVSNFMDPGYFTESVGVGYALDQAFKTRFGFAVKEAVTRDYNVYSDDPTTPEIEKLKVEPGVEWVTDAKLKLNQIVIYDAQLNVFSNCKAVDQIVVRWDNLLTAAVDKYVNVNFNFILYYDKTSSTQRQISETLSVGLTYSFL
jgi:hypothetical protein